MAFSLRVLGAPGHRAKAELGNGQAGLAKGQGLHHASGGGLQPIAALQQARPDQRRGKGPDLRTLHEHTKVSGMSLPIHTQSQPRPQDLQPLVGDLTLRRGRVHELWLIAPGAAPVSLGLLDAPELMVAYPRPPEGWTLAVSIEPAGGSPIGTPTGPVILTAEVGTDT
ncbi:MAG: hypothetical protein HC783_12365 [Rhodobacteraceae bacterium]|nr:hypothetical protein [Paracoccaceae bacterium]